MWFKYIHNDYIIEVTEQNTINRLLKDKNYQVFEPEINDYTDTNESLPDEKPKRRYTKRIKE